MMRCWRGNLQKLKAVDVVRRVFGLPQDAKSLLSVGALALLVYDDKLMLDELLRLSSSCLDESLERNRSEVNVGGLAKCGVVQGGVWEEVAGRGRKILEEGAGCILEDGVLELLLGAEELLGPLGWKAGVPVSALVEVAVGAGNGPRTREAGRRKR